MKLIVNSLGEPERSMAVLEQLGARHKAYGVTNSHYEIVGGVLIATLSDLFGENFTVKMREAWQTAFGLISTVMIQST